MKTTTRAEISKKNKYWIPKPRYYELKYFCLQYPSWKQAYAALDSLSKRPADLAVFSKTNVCSDPTSKCVESRIYFYERICMIETACKSTDNGLADYILKGVTEGISYEQLKIKYNIPCCRDTYYKLYRKFFWLLHGLRD